MADNVAAKLRLVLVTDDRLVRGRDLVALVAAAERGGATAVQLRLKEATGRELVALLRAMIDVVRIPVLVNDRPDVALAGGAAGVHLGADDLPVNLARRIVPRGFIIGASVGSADEAANAGAADYWGIGPWRETGTKTDAGVGLGRRGFERLIPLAEGKPCIAIGGVRPEDVPAVAAAGGVGVAVVYGILGAEDLEAAARSYARAWPGGRTAPG
jgi:thiamine-phosphate pyrophosphorylase